MSKSMKLNECGQVGGFSPGEKIITRATFNAGILIGAYGIWLSSPYFASAYLAYTLGSFTLLMRYTVCARCPHLLTAGDCLFLPPSLAKKLVSTKHAGPLLPWERAIFFGAFLGAALFPVWFLLQEPALLGAFIVLMGGSFLGLLLHFCKECHTTVCPLNKRRAGECKNALN
jgi:hypothetical protein